MNKPRLSFMESGKKRSEHPGNQIKETVYIFFFRLFFFRFDWHKKLSYINILFNVHKLRVALLSSPKLLGAQSKTNS